MGFSRFRAVAAVCLLVPVLAAGGAGAQPAPHGGPSLEDVELRDSLIARQESLLNVYRCLYGVDVAAVPGGCAGAEPARGPTQPGAFSGTPTQGDITARDALIADQEALLNAYRCRFNTDTQLVPGGCNAQSEPTDTDGIYTAIAAGFYHSCAITTQGAATCWGHNGDGKADAPDGTYTAIATSQNHSCTITTQGTATCWGHNGSGQADAPDGTYTAIAAGSSHSCAITTQGTATCWGHNGDGKADAPDGTYTAIATSRNHSCALGTDLIIVCWDWTTSLPPSITWAD